MCSFPQHRLQVHNTQSLNERTHTETFVRRTQTKNKKETRIRTHGAKYAFVFNLNFRVCEVLNFNYTKDPGTSSTPTGLCFFFLLCCRREFMHVVVFFPHSPDFRANRQGVTVAHEYSRGASAVPYETPRTPVHRTPAAAPSTADGIHVYRMRHDIRICAMCRVS